jgi:hypothetical protein
MQQDLAPELSGLWRGMAHDPVAHPCVAVPILGIFGCAIGRLGFGVYYRGMPFLESPRPPPFMRVDGHPRAPVPWSSSNLTESEWYHFAGLVFLAGAGIAIGVEVGSRLVKARNRTGDGPRSGQAG